MQSKNIENTAKGYTAKELSEKGPESIPDEYITSKHLIYNSPATLAFNSPGAEGFGVKRAGLAIPGSIMLIVSPGCCGRNTSDITRIKGYEDRFFYLEIENTDLVTGRHLKKIPDAVKEIVDFCDEKPSLVMICITCVDALLGTDMERVSKKAEEKAGIPVRPCYMYALTREGRKPPMVQVRQSLYSLLPAQKRRGTSVNILGFFAPLFESSELFLLLKAAGVKKIRQISTCENIEEFYMMGEANFNLVLNREADAAANDLFERLNIPSIGIERFYDPERIEKQYRALSNALGISETEAGEEADSDSSADAQAKKDEKILWDSGLGKNEAIQAISELKKDFPDISFSIGEVINANPFELALTLITYGFEVREIFANPDETYFYYIDRIAELSPETMVYSNMEPTMLYYDIDEDIRRVDRDSAAGDDCSDCSGKAGGSGAMEGYDTGMAGSGVMGDNGAGVATGPGAEDFDTMGDDGGKKYFVTLGKDAAFYHPVYYHVNWNSDEQPFGYDGCRKLFQEIRRAVSGE